MKVLTSSSVRTRFKAVMNSVCREHVPVIILHPRGAHVVLISLEDYNSMQTTMDLLSSPKNRARVLVAIAQRLVDGMKGD